MSDVSPTTSIIIPNVNGSSNPIKRQRLSNSIKIPRTKYMLLTGNIL